MWDLKKDKPARKGGWTCGRAGPELGEGHGALPGRGACGRGRRAACRPQSALPCGICRSRRGGPHVGRARGGWGGQRRPPGSSQPIPSPGGLWGGSDPGWPPVHRSPDAQLCVSLGWRCGDRALEAGPRRCHPCGDSDPAAPGGLVTTLPGPAGSSAGKPRPAHTVASSPAVPGSRLIRTGQRRLVPPGFSISFDCSVQMGSSVPSTTGAGSPEGEGAGRHPRGPRVGGPPRARMCLWAPLMPDARGRA